MIVKRAFDSSAHMFFKDIFRLCHLLLGDGERILRFDDSCFRLPFRAQHPKGKRPCRREQDGDNRTRAQEDDGSRRTEKLADEEEQAAA